MAKSRANSWAGEIIASQMKTANLKRRRAAELAKADLVSNMVGEFPELQGIMGGYYAAHGGEMKTPRRLSSLSPARPG